MALVVGCQVLFAAALDISSLFLKLSWRAVLATIPTDSLLHPSQFRGKYFCQRAIFKCSICLKQGTPLFLLMLLTRLVKLRDLLFVTRLLPSTESTPVTLSDLRPFYAKRLRLISLATKPSPSHPVLARRYLNLLMRYVNYTFHYIFSVLPPARSSMLATQLDDWQRGLVTTALLPNIPLTDENFCQLGLLHETAATVSIHGHLAPPLSLKHTG
jgi:hypothetical protein